MYLFLVFPEKPFKTFATFNRFKDRKCEVGKCVFQIQIKRGKQSKNLVLVKFYQFIEKLIVIIRFEYSSMSMFKNIKIKWIFHYYLKGYKNLVKICITIRSNCILLGNTFLP